MVLSLFTYCANRPLHIFRNFVTICIDLVSVPTRTISIRKAVTAGKVQQSIKEWKKPQEGEDQTVYNSNVLWLRIGKQNKYVRKKNTDEFKHKLLLNTLCVMQKNRTGRKRMFIETICQQHRIKVLHAVLTLAAGPRRAHVSFPFHCPSPGILGCPLFLFPNHAYIGADLTCSTSYLSKWPISPHLLFLLMTSQMVSEALFSNLTSSFESLVGHHQIFIILLWP